MAPESPAHIIGTITWTEIPAIDLTRIQNFYSTVFGWTCTPFEATATPDGEPTFVQFKKGATEGGFIKVTPESFSSPARNPISPEKKRIAVSVTITVENVDLALSAIEKAGGAIYLPKRKIPGDLGCFAYFTDTEGNVMCVWSAN